jgi:hypothetical protein
MKLRTVVILLLMACIVVLTSAFGTYQDGIEKHNELEFKHEKKKEKKVNSSSSNETVNISKDIVGASGAGTSYKQSQSHLNVAEKVDRPYVKDGPNEYRGKASGYDIHDSDSDSDSDDTDSENDKDEPKTEFQRKLKYIKTIFKEIFSKWNSQETIMAPISVEEDPDNPLGTGSNIEGLQIREKFKKHSRNGIRKLKNAFRGRFN